MDTNLSSATLALMYALWRTLTPDQMQALDAQLRAVAQALQPHLVGQPVTLVTDREP